MKKRTVLLLPLLLTIVLAVCTAATAHNKHHHHHSSAATTTDSSGVLFYSEFAGQPYTVTYDSRALLLNGRRAAFLSGSVHYPRSTPAMWPSIMRRAKEAGLNMVQTYVFWSYHEPVRGQITFEGNADLRAFVQAAAAADLFVSLRIGPYVCGEYQMGGFPYWLRDIQGVVYRAGSVPFEKEMHRFLALIINETRDLMADRGGPIVLTQIENELWWADDPYMEFLYETVREFDSIGAQWIMCNGKYTNNSIETCNGNDCTDFINQHGGNGRVLIDQPALWTENEGWFKSWGDVAGDSRALSDYAYAISRWFARGGSMMNYYMFHGGNHYGVMAGDGCITAYCDHCNLRSDGLPNEPKSTHLSALHRVVATFAQTMLSTQAVPTPTKVESWDASSQSWVVTGQQLSFLFSSSVSSSAVLLLENSAHLARVRVNGHVFDMAQESVLWLLPGSSMQVVFNTSAIPAPATKRVQSTWNTFSAGWQQWSEPRGVSVASTVLPTQHTITSSTPLDQLALTHMLTYDHVWYETNITWPAARAKHGRPHPHRRHTVNTNSIDLVVETSKGQAFSVFVNGVYAGEGWDSQHAMDIKMINITVHLSADAVAVKPGQEVLFTVLSSSLGVFNMIENGFTDAPLKGLCGRMWLGGKQLTGAGSGLRTWLQRAGPAGQVLGLPDNPNQVTWQPLDHDNSTHMGAAATWYRASFPSPVLGRDSELLLDATGLGRGHAFVNGQDIGRYFLAKGWNNQATQSQYHIPVDWLRDDGSDNLLVLFEEIGAPALATVSLVIAQQVPA